MTEKESVELRKILNIYHELQSQADFHDMMSRSANAKIDMVLARVREILDKDKKPLTGGKA